MTTHALLQAQKFRDVANQIEDGWRHGDPKRMHSVRFLREVAHLFDDAAMTDEKVKWELAEQAARGALLPVIGDFDLLDEVVAVAVTAIREQLEYSERVR